MAHNTIEDFQGADIIDVRDIIARVEELRTERQDLVDTADELSQDDDEYGEAQRAIAAWDAGDEAKELETLEELLSDLCGYGGDEQWEGDWYPVTLINEDHFETAMYEMLEDIGDIPKDLPSYLTITVDYDALKQDYSEVDFDGTTYYYR